jgi:serine transporter
MYAVRAVPAMRQYRAASNVFVLVMGLIALSALIYGLM